MRTRMWMAALGSMAVMGCGKSEPTPAAVSSAEAAKPAEPKPAEPKPEEPKPAEAKPEEPKPEEPKPEEPKPAEAKPEEPKPAGKKHKAKKEDKEKGKAARREFQRLLDEGRKLVKADDAMAGMAKLEEALKQIPGHPSALGELGWAAYRAGPSFFDKSLDATRKALSVSKKPKQKGALWYNLGRVFEDQGNLAMAVDSYRESLAVRPGNAAVQERLDALVAKLGGKSSGDGLSKLEDACMELRTEQGCETAASAEGHIMHSCECATELLGPEEGFGKAALMRVTGMSEMSGSVDATYLAVEIASRWHVVSMVGNDWSPGAFGISNTSTRSAVEFKKVGGQVLLWVLYENEMNDTDMGIDIVSSEWSRTLTLCGMHESKMTCLSVPLGTGSSVERLGFDDTITDAPQPSRSRVAWTATMGDDGAISFANEEKVGETELSFEPAGKLTFAQLMTTPGVVVHPL